MVMLQTLVVVCLLQVAFSDVMLPESGADRHHQYSAQETCRQQLRRATIRFPGCAPKSVVMVSCRGTCHSRNVPEWRYSSQAMQMVEHCTCCKPHVRRFRYIEFTCPSRPGGRLRWRQWAALQCACRPCADAEPEAEQPYDY
ncbi:bursicon-like [Haliotis asinina]|uniref:bursicon-like n=1 Tax=Haliotis asinina TaxID=109174 RepID=UPI0035326369